MRGVRSLVALGILLAIVWSGTDRAPAAGAAVVTDFNHFLIAGKARGEMRLDDRIRKFVIVTPTGASLEDPRPLVFFFHGAGGSAEQAAHTYGWVEKARRENFFLVLPDGLPARPDQPPHFTLNPRVWRDGRPDLPGRGVNDDRFFAILLDKLTSVLPIDPRRIYATGFSNGAGLVFTLGAHHADRLAAIAPVASQSFTRVEKIARPLPIYYLTGLADPLIPYHGGTVDLPWGTTALMPPVQETLDAWIGLDACPVLPETVSDHEGVRVVRYDPGPAGGEILFTTVAGNGHHWPGTLEPLPATVAGPARDPFSATDRIWEFFEQHPLPGKP